VTLGRDNDNGYALNDVIGFSDERWRKPIISRYLTLINIVALKSGVTQGHWKWYYLKDWLRFPIRIPWLLTVAVYCIILKTYRDIGQKSRFFRTHLHSTPPLGGSQSEYCHYVWYRKTRMVCNYLTVKQLWGYVQQCLQNTGVWWTDGQTDGLTDILWQHSRTMHMRCFVKTGYVNPKFHDPHISHRQGQ